MRLLFDYLLLHNSHPFFSPSQIANNMYHKICQSFFIYFQPSARGRAIAIIIVSMKMHGLIHIGTCAIFMDIGIPGYKKPFKDLRR